MAKFLVLFLVPPDVVANWKATAAEIREPAEAKMQAEWGAWMKKHGAAVSGTEAAGKTKRVAAEGVSDIKNDIMLTCFAEADSHEAAVAMFQGHPHLTIPQSSIEIMAVRAMGPGSAG